MKHVLLDGLLLLFSSCTPNAAIEAGTDCDEHCPVGAERISAKEASGSCGLDGSYNPFTDAVSIGGTCVGTGKCQVVCLYPECGEGKTLVITARGVPLRARRSLPGRGLLRPRALPQQQRSSAMRL